MATIQREIRKRGFFGHVFKWLFILFNIVMLAWFVGGLMQAGGVVAGASSEAERAGATLGTAVGIGMVLTLWVMGDCILALFVVFTRGRKIIVTEEA